MLPAGMRACPQCLAVFVADPEFCSFDGTRLGADDVLIGKILEGHRIDAMIGIGGTGCVFRGTRISDNAPCAIKVLFGEMATDRSIAARFEREARAMSAIQHRNVVSIFDFGTTKNGLIYLVMSYLDGVTLKERIEADAPLRADHAGRILEQLTAGLAEAHRQGFVHRDLKPGNVILTGSFGREEVKILDFGIVASLRDVTERERLTKTGYIVGTPTYMAPEQVDPSAVTPQVDVYALGVILYEMLMGDPPFVGTLEQILVAKMTQTPAPIPDGGDLGELVLQMLDMDPEKRPPSALHVSAELSRLSLLTDDPATVRADMPELALWGVDTVGQDSSVKLVDRTDENDFDDHTHEDATKEAPPGHPDAWVADTKRVDVVDPSYMEFGDVSTRDIVEGRSDTVIDHPVHEDAFDQLPAMATPTDPAADARTDAALEAEGADTGESDVGEEVPTRITERPASFDTLAPSAIDTFEGNKGEAITALNLLDAESDPWIPTPEVDAAGDADTALDMRLDHLLSAPPPSIAPPQTSDDVSEPDQPLVSPITTRSGTKVVVREPSRFLALGILLAVVIGIAAAVALVVSNNETVIVDVPVSTHDE